jgi:hypothetical protein
MKISPLLVEVKEEIQAANIRVKRTMMPSRSFMEGTQNRTTVDKIGSKDATMVVTNEVYRSMVLHE